MVTICTIILFHRWSKIDIKEVDFKTLRKEKGETDIEKVSEKLEAISISQQSCPLCKMTFSDEEQLRKHIRTEHPETHSSNPRECPECNKMLSSAQALHRHIKTIHRTCSVRDCKMVFESSEDMTEHKKVHTTCEVCGTDWIFPSKLKIHMKSHK